MGSLNHGKQRETKMTQQELVYYSKVLQQAAADTNNHWLALKLIELDRNLDSYRTNPTIEILEDRAKA